MPLYRLLLIRDGEPVGSVARHFADDLDALDAARSLCGDQAVEIYREVDLVGRLKQGDALLTVKDLRSL